MSAHVTTFTAKGRMAASDDAALSEHAVEPMLVSRYSDFTPEPAGSPSMAFELYVRKGKRSSQRVRVYLDGDDLRTLWAGFDKLTRLMDAAKVDVAHLGDSD